MTAADLCLAGVSPPPVNPLPGRASGLSPALSQGNDMQSILIALANVAILMAVSAWIVSGVGR